MDTESFKQWMSDGGFLFQHLMFDGIDNTTVLSANRSEMALEEMCLFHRTVTSGDDYLNRLHAYIGHAADARKPGPVVRFADGEYAFYGLSLHCNGLYHQAESVDAIHAAIPLHAEALEYLSAGGLIAPLIFPGNVTVTSSRRPWYQLFKRYETPAWGLGFLDFLQHHGVVLNADNYIPFYTVYAYLTSSLFFDWIDGRSLCIIGSEYHSLACQRWFGAAGSRPALSFTKVPEAYVATRWPEYRNDILEALPSEAELCLVGAGIGSLLVCTDVARRLDCPVIDAGHIMNLMNGREEKSNGARLFTRRPGG